MKIIQSKLVVIFVMIILPFIGIAQNFFDSNGTEIHYKIAGKGQAVILIHGFTEHAPLAWEQAIANDPQVNIFQTLAKKFQVIAIDTRGHGQSGKPIGKRYYGERMVADIARLMDHLGINKAHIVGYSMGAVIAGNFASQYKERTKSIIMIGAVPISSEMFEKSTVVQQVNLETVDCLYGDCGINPLLGWVLPFEQSEETLDGISAQLLRGQNKSALASCLLGFSDLLQLDPQKIRDSEVPTSIIIGQFDPFLKFTKEYEQIPSSKLTVIEGATHIDILSKQNMLNSIWSFLNSDS